MRLDDVSPRTLLLGGFAGWAVVAWALALAGMGGHLPGPASGVVAASPLPAAPRTSAPAVAPFGSYQAIAARPLFAVDRRPHPFVLQTETGAPADAPEFDLVLTSVLISPQAGIAIVQKPDGSGSWRVRIGESAEPFPGWRLLGLQPRSATFVGPEGEKVLDLRVFNGQGGTAPTATAGPVPPPVEMPGPVPVPVPPPPPPPASTTGPGSPAASVPKPPPTDASAAPDPEQIEAIRRRIEARREQMRQRAQSTPPATATPSPPTR